MAGPLDVRRALREDDVAGSAIGSGEGSRRRAAAGAFAAAVLAVLVGVGACGSDGDGSPTPSGAAAVVRTVFAAGNPAAAPGQRLELVRYTIPPHTKLAAHHHPGTQLALIESGTLTYTVIEGSVVVHAPDDSTRTIGPGETDTIKAGEWIAETERVVHYGSNATDQPLVILVSSLLAVGEPAAIPESPAPST